MYKRLSAFVTIIMIITLIVTGCTSQASNIGLARENDRDTVGTDFVVAEVGSYDSADTAVVISVEPETGSVTFMNIESGKQYTLSYDGTTYVKDKYEGPMSMAQIKAGDIVDITFLKSKKRLASVQISPSSWVLDNIENYDLGGLNKTAIIGSNTYALPDEVVVISEGQRKEVMDIVNKDVLTVSGIGHDIYSIDVKKGHGYLRLSNDQALVGGWIEVGNAVIQKISENMLLAVPEGSYQVLLTNGNASCVKDVVVERNKEVILDVGELEILQDKVGKLLISVNPSTATVSVDGEIVDISEEVELTYGIHKIRLEAEDYLTMTKYIQVGSEYASLSFTMEEGNKEEEDNSVSGNNSYNDIIGAVTGNRVYIDAPLNVEVYVDGNYVGVSPVNFTKVTGDHTITLSKEGYQSRSYTIYLYDDGEDITYSFTDLVSEYDAVSGTNRVTSRKTSSRSSYAAENIEKYEITIKVPQQVNIYLKNDKSDQYEYIGYENEVTLTLEKGNYTIKLEKEGYVSIVRPITVDRNRKNPPITFQDLTPENSGAVTPKPVTSDKDPNSGDQNNSDDQNKDKDPNSGDDQNKGDDQNSGDDQSKDDDQNSGDDQNKGDDQNSGDDQNKGDDQNSGDDQNKGDDQSSGKDENTGGTETGTGAEGGGIETGNGTESSGGAESGTGNETNAINYNPQTMGANIKNLQPNTKIAKAVQ